MALLQGPILQSAYIALSAHRFRATRIVRKYASILTRAVVVNDVDRGGGEGEGEIPVPLRRPCRKNTTGFPPLPSPSASPLIRTSRSLRLNGGRPPLHPPPPSLIALPTVISEPES